MKSLVLRLITLYQSHISAHRPPSCRFSPTCSAYAFEAISRFGLWKGTKLSLLRLAKCHPFYKGKTGYFDPVPDDKK